MPTQLLLTTDQWFAVAVLLQGPSGIPGYPGEKGLAGESGIPVS